MITGIIKPNEIVRYYVREKSNSDVLVELPMIKAKIGDVWYFIPGFSSDVQFVATDYITVPVANLGIKTSLVTFDTIQDYINWFTNSKSKSSEVNMVS